MSAVQSAGAAATPAAHRAFLNRYYGISRHFYDVTRKYYLFGRDRLVTELLEERWSRLIEIGSGTGRNLQRLHRGRPDAKLGGVDASDEMVAHATKRCSFAAIRFGFAEEIDLGSVLGTDPDRVLFSYSLSMVGAPALALAKARSALAPGGSVAVVDFGDFAGLGRTAAEAFRKYLAAFHVRPLDPALLDGAESIQRGPLGYFVIARFAPLP